MANGRIRFGKQSGGVLGLLFPDGVTDTEVTLPESGTVDTEAQVSIAQPVGAIMAFASSTTPSGYLKANGALVSRSTYANLFTAIGTTFGAGDGSTTFALPDLRGEFIRGFDDGKGTDSGRTIGSWQADEFKSHYHNWGTNNLSISQYGAGAPGFETSAGATNSTGGTETRPRNIALLYCIKY